MALRPLPVRGLQARSPGPKCAVIFHPFPQLSPVPQASSASLPIGDQTVKRPRLVGSVYDLSGTTQLPYTSPRPYPAGSSRTLTFFEMTPRTEGTEYASRLTSPQDPASATMTRLIWEPDRVVLASIDFTFVVATFNCTFSPPLEIVPLPIRAGDLPAQSASGPQCRGTAQVTVMDEEPLSAAGRQWDTWKMHTVITYQAQTSLEVTVDTTSWFSPELGVPVATKETQTGNVGGATFSSELATRLSTLP